MGRREMAMAPMTILVLKRAPSCCLLRSAKNRKVVRPRIKRKTRSAAVTKVETTKNGAISPQLRASKGTSSEPRVKTAASRRVRRIPATITRQRGADFAVLMREDLRGQARRIARRQGAG